MEKSKKPIVNVGITKEENRNKLEGARSKEELLQSAKKYISKSKSKNTLRTYVNGWKEFEDWCLHHGFSSMPASEETVISYISDLADRGSFQIKPSGEIERRPLKAVSIQQRLYAIRFWHQAKGYPSPTYSFKVRDTMAGIRNDKGTLPSQKRAADVEIIKAICRIIPDTLTGHRNRALLLLGFCFGARRSELISVDVEHIRYTNKGLELLIPRSKTDQEGKGRKPVIFYGEYPETCPVRSLQKWLKVSGISSGAIFRKIDRHGNIGERLTPDGFRYIFERMIKNAGFNPKDFSPHSLRHGFITTAYLAGKDEQSIMMQTGHRSTQTMRRYIDDAVHYINNATDGIGL
jgi:site-specific recombinase XerD